MNQLLCFALLPKPGWDSLGSQYRDNGILGIFSGKVEDQKHTPDHAEVAHCGHIYLLDLGVQWASHVVGCGWPCPGLREEIKGVWGEWRSQLGVEARSGGSGGLMSPRPLCHVATSQVQGEACRPPTRRRENNSSKRLFF